MSTKLTVMEAEKGGRNGGDSSAVIGSSADSAISGPAGETLCWCAGILELTYEQDAQFDFI